MNRHLLSSLLLMSLACPITAQPKYDMKNIQREQLNRGVVAFRTDSNRVVVTWRSLTEDKPRQGFDVYRNGKKINPHPITSGGTFFTDTAPVSGDATYEVKVSGSKDTKGRSATGSWPLKADSPVGYLPIRLDRPEGGTSPDGRSFTYTANDASVGDVDGDGQYEIILKWEPTNARDNSHGGFTGNTLFDCYRLDGTRLWRIDMGRNIRSGAHYVPFIVYDLDGDGKAEMMVKTADGTVDGKGKVIGDGTKDWRINDEFDKRSGRILDGPEYMTVFNGETGEAMATEDYIPERGDISDWGDGYGNRSERYLAAVGYLDGRHASAVFCRGYYTRSVLAAWDWDGRQLKRRWVFDTDDKRWRDYAGQGNHNLRVADVDGDGCDEITYGSMAVDHDGTGLYNTGMGHGDAIHLMPFYPDSDRLQVWDCHENRRDGSDFRDAATGKVIFQIKAEFDVGRCMAADIDPTNPGVEMWSAGSHGIRNVKGEAVVPADWRSKANADDKHDGMKPGVDDDTALYQRGIRIPTNFGIWWDGDLLREMLDHETVSKYDWNTGRMRKIARFTGCQFNNWTKSNPCLSADILGDWREEVVTRTPDSSELRVYVSPVPTSHRIPCLMEDIPYRLSVATENVGYNQPPETGFYLGAGMKER